MKARRVTSAHLRNWPFQGGFSGSVDAEGNVITQIETTTLTPEEYEALEDKTGCVANISGYQNANVVISVEEYNGVEDTTGYEEVIENYTKTATIYPARRILSLGALEEAAK